MSKDPAMLFYPNDYIGGTMGMTFEQKGAYMELLMLQFNRGHMTSHMIGQTVGQLFGQIQDKFVQDDKGLWYNKRVDEEKLKRQNYVSSRLNNKLGVNQYTKKAKSESGHMTGHMENEDVNEDKDINKDVNEIFDWWNLKEIIVHNKLTDEIKNKARTKLNDYSVEEICNSIYNYEVILRGDYYFKYKWTLKDFLQRGIDKFMDLEIAKSNYKSKPINSKLGTTRQSVQLTEEEKELYR